MELNYNKIIKTMISLSDLNASEVSENIGVNKVSLSRNESKYFYLKVRQFFNEYDSEINEAMDLIIEHFDFELDEEVKKMVAEDPKSLYKINPLKQLKAEIRKLNDEIRTYKKIENTLESQIKDKQKIIELYEADIEKYNFELEKYKNKQTG